MEEHLERAKVVACAYTWLRTPYHHKARVKHHGVDCLTLLAEVFEEAQLIPHIEIEHYPPDWMLHRDTERYLEGLLKYTREIEDGDQKPGDIVIWKIGRCFSHAAIIVEWPQCIHAVAKRSVVMEDVQILALSDDNGKPRPRRFFSYW